MERLGAIVRRYVPNQYGTTSSPLHGGLPTDRCIAEWWISRAAREAILEGQPIRSAIRGGPHLDSIRHREPFAPKIPRAREKSSKKPANSSARRSIAGLAVIGFEKSEQAGTYLLGKWEST
jgi:predicted GNAT superfamily acetyltransferase